MNNSRYKSVKRYQPTWHIQRRERTCAKEDRVDDSSCHQNDLIKTDTRCVTVSLRTIPRDMTKYRSYRRFTVSTSRPSGIAQMKGRTRRLWEYMRGWHSAMRGSPAFVSVSADGD